MKEKNCKILEIILKVVTLITFISLLLGLIGLYFWLYFENYIIRLSGLALVVLSIYISRKFKEKN